MRSATARGTPGKGLGEQFQQLTRHAYPSL